MRKALLFFSFLFIQIPVWALHILGGQIYYKSLPNGNYQFFVEVLYDCTSTTILSFQPLQVYSSNLPKNIDGIQITQIQLSLDTIMDISPVCNPAGPQLSCNDSLPQLGSIRKYIFSSSEIRFYGQIPDDGWTYTYTQNFRSTNILNLTTTQDNSMVLYTTMYKYNQLPCYPSFDSSPQTHSNLSTNYYAGVSVIYNPLTDDADGDSLSFQFTPPLYGSINGQTFNPPTSPLYCTYVSGYSYSNPTPDQSFNPQNIPSTLNPANGTLEFKCYNQGFYIIEYEIKSYRNGHLISKSNLEFLTSISPSTQSNHPPILAQGPLNQSTLELDLTIGDTMDINLLFIDLDTLPNSLQQQIDATLSSPFLSDSTGSTPNYSYQITYTQNHDSAFVHLFWIPACSALEDYQVFMRKNADFHFYVTCKDDYCPFPAYSFFDLIVHLKSKPYSGPTNFTLQQDSTCHFQVNQLPNAQFHWFYQDQIINGATTNAYAGQGNGGDYSVYISINSGDCEKFDTTITTYCSGVGIHENELQLFQIYEYAPNEFQLQSNYFQLEAYECTIYNQLGQTLKSWENPKSSQGPIKFEFNSPEGIYFLGLKNPSGEFRIVKFLKNPI